MKRLILLTWLAVVPSLYLTLSATQQIRLKDVSVREAIAAVGKSTDYSIVVKATSVDLTRKVSVDAADNDIENALSQIFVGQNVTWTIDGRNISVTAAQPKTSTPEPTVKKNVTGKVIDPDGEPLIGATLMIKGSSTGFITDVNGNFEIKGINFPATFTVSYIGFNDMEVTFNGSEHDYAVVMSDFANRLEDVVVVGYGTQKRVNITGAVSVISNDILEHRPVTNTAAAIQGADPSLLLTNRNGSIEGDEYSMAIRGTLSLNSGSPLVLVDGVEGSMTNLNPNDIESISVLKDASACAVYGAKASAGVVLITTKSGEAGVTKVSYNGRASISTNTTSTDFMTCSYDYVNLTNDFYRVLKGYNAWTFSDEQMAMLEARRYDVTEDPSRPWVFEDESGRYTWMYAANFDWYGYLFKRIRPETEHNVTVTGGNNKVKYYASGRYLYREGVFNANAADDLNSLSFRAKIDAEISKWLHYSNNISFSRSKYEYGGFAEQDGNTKTGAYGGAHSAFYNANQNIGPFYTPFNPDGSIVITPGFMADSDSQLGTGRVPAWMSDRNHNEKVKNSLVMMNRFVFDISKFVKFNVDYTYKRDDNLTSYRCLPVEGYNNVAKTMYSGNGYTSGAIYDYFREIRYYMDGHVLNGYLSWDQEFGKHHIGVTAGVNYDHYRSSQIILMQSGSLSNNLSYINMANGEITTATEANSAYQTLGFFGRVNYDFAGKYLLEVSGRYDGSSRFPSSSRWGFFPSVSAGWRMSEEDFWEPIKGWWNRSKLRLSYGTLGNQQVSNYYYIDTISTKQMSSYTFNGTDKTSYAQISDPVSDGLTWETVVTYNLGLDLGFLRDRLSVGVDLYIRDTKNMLTKSITLPSVYGATSPKENAADLRTKGYEITIGWRDNLKVAGHPMSYGITGSLGDYKTTITRYNNPTKLLTDYYEGMTLGEIWGYRIDGLFASDEEAAEYAKWIDDRAVNAGVYNCVAPYNKLMAGDPKFLDLDGSNTIDSGSNTVDDPGDRRIIGNSLPRFLYSLRGDFSYFGFDVNVFFQGVGKCDWMPNEACDYFWVTYRNQRPTFIPNDFEEKCWSEANPNAYFPRRRSQIAHTSFNKANDRYLQNCAYLRLKNVTIGYTLPIKNTKAIEKCRFYFSGENLAYWSPMKKYCSSIDPEVATTGAVNDCMYPYAKTFTFGVDLTF